MIVLIPKVSNLKIFTQFRPINLCSVLYKLIMKEGTSQIILSLRKRWFILYGVTTRGNGWRSRSNWRKPMIVSGGTSLKLSPGNRTLPRYTREEPTGRASLAYLLGVYGRTVTFLYFKEDPAVRRK
ncbi:hypothetical protein PVK06_034116 [Gossypium arboreum]|uniref:Uncharacterized protein n=1 Tax=Gossypium arboreum TaxID=29729 RepID=A0ABR0NDA0_GOSAR|nr:hypothetical protein PVK06_034116 [Gossypium arboreum]